jgi:ribosomal protein S18 acetylase RimI-like enzyme
MNTDEHGFKIRKAGKRDLKEIAEIFRVESAKKPYNTKFTKISALKDILNCFENDIYIAISEEKIVGFLASHILKSDKEIAFVDELWVRPKFQNRGVGKSLLDLIGEKYKKRGVIKLRLSTFKKAKAVGFYKKLNYEESKELIYLDKKL